MGATRLGARLTRVYASSVRGIRSSLGYDVAVDLGTATTRLYAYGRGLVLCEPTVLAYSLHTGALEAAGEAAKLQIGRESRSRRVSHPLRYGVVSDSHVAGRLLDCFLNRALPRRSFWKPHLLMVAPSVTTELERRALEDAGYRAGAGRVTLIAASQAIAAGAPLAEGWRTVMVVDIGAGKTDVAILCRQGVINARTFQIGMAAFDYAIESHLRQTRGLEIGATTAEALKIELGAAVEQAEPKEMEIGARRASNGLPEKAVVTRAEVLAATKPLVKELLSAVRATLDACPPEAAGDLFETGIVLSGGGALLAGLADVIAADTGLDVHVMANPLTAPILGAGRLLEPLVPATPAPPVRTPVAQPAKRPAAELGLSGAAAFQEKLQEKLQEKVQETALYTLAETARTAPEISSVG